jgi:hypothetical protein
MLPAELNPIYSKEQQKYTALQNKLRAQAKALEAIKLRYEFEKWKLKQKCEEI